MVIFLIKLIQSLSILRAKVNSAPFLKSFVCAHARIIFPNLHKYSWCTINCIEITHSLSTPWSSFPRLLVFASVIYSLNNLLLSKLIMTNEELWRAALGEIELSISKANFITWFKNTHILSVQDGRAVIGVPNGFAKEWLENKYNLYILRALRNIQSDIKEVSCVITTNQESVFKKPSVDAVVAIKKLNVH